MSFLEGPTGRIEEKEWISGPGLFEPGGTRITNRYGTMGRLSPLLPAILCLALWHCFVWRCRQSHYSSSSTAEVDTGSSSGGLLESFPFSACDGLFGTPVELTAESALQDIQHSAYVDMFDNNERAEGHSPRSEPEGDGAHLL
jgi:hypothetical protein